MSKKKYSKEFKLMFFKEHNEKRIKQSLGYKSPIEYRKELGLI